MRSSPELFQWGRKIMFVIHELKFTVLYSRLATFHVFLHLVTQQPTQDGEESQTAIPCVLSAQLTLLKQINHGLRCSEMVLSSSPGMVRVEGLRRSWDQLRAPKSPWQGLQRTQALPQPKQIKYQSLFMPTPTLRSTSLWDIHWF